MVAKLLRKLKLYAAARSAQAPRHWTANPFGRSVLDAELLLLQQLVPAPGNRRIIELATVETPVCGLPVTAQFAAAQQSWRLPVVAALSQLPLLSNSVDVILWRYLALDSKNRLWLLQEAARVLAPNGMLLCAHLNPLFTACWRHTDLLNLSYQSATALVASAGMADLRLEGICYAGPGWWKYRALRISKFRKPMASRVDKRVRAGGLARRPATAMVSVAGVEQRDQQQ